MTCFRRRRRKQEARREVPVCTVCTTVPDTYVAYSVCFSSCFLFSTTTTKTRHMFDSFDSSQKKNKKINVYRYIHFNVNNGDFAGTDWPTMEYCTVFLVPFKYTHIKLLIQTLRFKISLSDFTYEQI